MQNTMSTRKNTRARSNGSNNINPGPEDSNLNGEKYVEKVVKEELMEIDAPKDATPSLDDSNAEEKPKGRKRKASEMKLNNNVAEEPLAKDKPTVNDEPAVEAQVAQDAALNGNEDLNKDGVEVPDLSFNDVDRSLGKGKRARIPNKRYSDFPLKTPTRLNFSESETPSNLENGEVKDIVDSGSNTDASEQSGSVANSPNVATIKSTRLSLIASPATSSHKKKLNADLTNPNYLKPFNYGWKRELVYRAVLDGSAKRNGDIYYYTPNGRKVRSMREVSEHLKNKELTLEDFTFTKEPLGLEDPEKEIIRDAKIKSATGTPLTKKLTPKSSKTPKSPKISTPITSDEKEKPIKEKVAKIKSSPRTSSFKIKLTKGGAIKTRNSKNDNEGDMEVGTYPPNWSPSPTSNERTKTGNLVDGNKPCRPCSIRCEGVSGLIPNLQCRICLCLYHHECVGLTSLSHVKGYVCKNCQPDEDQTQNATPAIAPPPLTPINVLKSVTAKSTTLPKLKRIPKVVDGNQSVPQSVNANQDQDPISKPQLPHLTPKPVVSDTSDSADLPVPVSENKSIVGSVTTWFPSSSTIQVSDNESVSTPECPQYIGIIGDKKYLVIPKHTVMSVSPTAKPLSTDESDLTSKENTEPSNNSENLNSTSVAPCTDTTEPDCSSKSADESPLEDKKDVSGGGDDAPKVDDSLIGKRKQAASSAKKRKRSSKAVAPEILDESAQAESTKVASFLQDVSFGYSSLLYIFQYLKVQDLLHASCVCSMWRDLAGLPTLWKTVRMKNSQIHSFQGLADALQRHGTVHLDLRKMLLPNNGNDDIWQEFSNVIKKVDTLKKIELCRCPATVIEQLALSNPKLEVINAVTIKCEGMSLATLVFLKDLQELRLKSTAGFVLTSDLTALADLKALKHLSLTSIKDLNKLNINVIADLRNLESLDLGECADFPKTFGTEILTRLDKLEKLRLEKGQGNCYTFEILDAVRRMPLLEQLELVNFDIKTGFDRALGACTNIKKLLIIPTYISQSATTNHMVLGGVLRLQSNLSHFVWGITLELLRVTELFVDQCEDADKKEKKDKKQVGNGDSIPVLKPVPLLKDGESLNIPPAQDPPQVEILPLPNLQKLLLQSLPTTRVKILKIPFHATWRQSITDTVN